MKIGDTVKMRYGSDNYLLKIDNIQRVGITGRYRYLGSGIVPQKESTLTGPFTFSFETINSIEPSDLHLEEAKKVKLGLGLQDAVVGTETTTIEGFIVPNEDILEVAKAIKGIKSSVKAGVSDFYVLAYGDKSISLTSDVEYAKRLARTSNAPHVHHYRIREGGAPLYISRITG